MRSPRGRDGTDDGFALLMVIFVTSIVMVGVAAALTRVGPNINSARQNQDSAAAYAAARSGIDDVVAYLVSVPSCRSESRICPVALGQSSDALSRAGTPRPKLASGQSVSWTTASTPTPDGFVRATSVGRSGTTTRKLVADLSLRPSILAYGYYTDYEAFSPGFLSSYYKPRSIYLNDANSCSSAGATCSASSVKYFNWKGPSNPNVCGQHWYAEPGLTGRAAATNPDAPVNEAGTYGTTASSSAGSAISRKFGCDLVFSTSMVQNGKTFTRDAILTSGSGPRFNQPVYTMWGYNDGTKNFTNPAFPAAGQYYRGSTMTNSPNLPQVAQADLTLPSSITKDGIPENACVYSGPTRVKLNGNGTATVTSPLTRTKNAASDAGCYPASVAAGVVGFTLNYNTVGAGAIVTRNIGTAPTGGWPVNPTRSSQTPSASNEVFYFNAPGNVDPVQPADKSAAAYSGCSGTVKYSAALDATCAWTTVGVTTEGSGATGWTSYTKTTCGSTATTNRQLFECEYAGLGSTSSPAVAQAAGQYKTLRDNVQTDLNGASCLTGTASAQATCVNTLVSNRLKIANTGGTVTGTATSGAHRYVATTVAGTPVTSTYATGSAGTGPNGTTDSFFVQPAPAKVSVTETPLTTTVTRQVYSSSSGWGSDVAAFTATTTQSDYSTVAARSKTYFPDERDVTEFGVGTDSAGTAVKGTGITPAAGDRAPGDLYIDGANKGKLSALADNDIVITGNITNPSGYTPDTDAVSLAAGVDVRNYHPVACLEQGTDAINNTTTGWCPNDVLGYAGSNTYSNGRYVNIGAVGDRVVQAAVFALSGSFGTDNYNRGAAVGDLNIQGGLYQSHRGGNGVISGSTEVSGTTLQYTYVDLQRADLPYVPPSTSGNYTRPWNVVSLSAG